jgi:hypothetical protein
MVRPDLRRGVLLALSVAVYAAAVLGRWRDAVARADARGCVDAHAVQDQALLLAGLLAGLALAGAVLPWGHRLVRGLLPQADPGRRLALVRAAAGVAVALGGAANFLWAAAPLDRFLDAHRLLLAEADLAIYGMGTVAGIAWSALLGREGWLCLLVMPAMGLMWISAGVVGSGWC